MKIKTEKLAGAALDWIVASIQGSKYDPDVTGALGELMSGAELESAIDCLTDGPPQHALANVLMVTLLQRILTRLKAK